MVEEWHASFIVLWLKDYPTGLFCYPAGPAHYYWLPGGVGMRLDLTHKKIRHESVFGRRFVLSAREELRRTLICNFRGHNGMYSTF